MEIMRVRNERKTNLIFASRKMMEQIFIGYNKNSEIMKDI